MPLTPVKGIHMNCGNTVCVIYTSGKAYLLLKFFEKNAVYVNVFYNEDISDRHKLQKFQ